MAEEFDTQRYYQKLANKEPLTEDEVLSLLKAVTTYQAATAYLASCQAATLEGLPKSTSKSAYQRHVSICRVASELLDGDFRGIRIPTSLTAAQNRCRQAITRAEERTNA